MQAAVKIVLEPAFEADFLPCSFGFRPKRRAAHCLQVPRTKFASGAPWVVETDVAQRPRRDSTLRVDVLRGRGTHQ